MEQASFRNDRRKFPYQLQEWLWYSLLLRKQPLKIPGLRVKPQQRDDSFKDRVGEEDICFCIFKSFSLQNPESYLFKELAHSSAVVCDLRKPSFGDSGQL